MTSFHVSPEDAGTRLDLLLSARLGVSRAAVQTMMKNGLVTRNGAPAIAHKTVHADDEIAYDLPAAETPAAPVESPELDIIFEDDELLVVNKPAGLLVHPNTEDEARARPTLTATAVKHAPGMARVGENALRPGVMHRLDKDVSGVMVLAKTQETYDDLKRQFAEREADKHYVALAYGKMSKDHDVISLPIARSKARGRMVARPASQEGKEAITEYTVLERLKTATLLDVKTHTGRTHQIRTHFFAINHPLVGDALYRKAHMRHIRPIDLGRVFLHASSLTVARRDGTRQTFTAPLPKELEDLLASLPRL